ncbi:MAG: 50S ribosomal protein L44e [Candidatus Micrarchaeia archaeon]
MKFPNKIRAFCPKCKKYTEHKVRMPSKGRNRTLAVGNRKHERKIKGYTGKVAGEKSVKKQGKKQRILIICSVCNKKQDRTIGTRTRKKLEIKT